MAASASHRQRIVGELLVGDSRVRVLTRRGTHRRSCRPRRERAPGLRDGRRTSHGARYHPHHDRTHRDTVLPAMGRNHQSPGGRGQDGPAPVQGSGVQPLIRAAESRSRAPSPSTGRKPPVWSSCALSPQGRRHRRRPSPYRAVQPARVPGSPSHGPVPKLLLR